MKKNVFVAALAAIALLLGFQNCGLTSSSHTDLNSLGKTCLATAERAFRDTYYPHVRSQCSQCHDNGGQGISWFASADPQFAFTAFMNTGREKLNSMMVYDGHPGPNNGPNQQGFVSSMSAQWTGLDKQIDECMNSAAVTTVPKNNSVQDIAINDNNDSNRRPWRTLEYDLFSDMALAQSNGAIHMIVRLQYRESGGGLVRAGANRAGLPCQNGTAAADCQYNADIGYEFRNPVARIRGGAPAGTQYSIDKMNVMMNGKKLSSVTSFEAIDDVVIGSATDAPLLTSATSPGITEKTPGSDTFQLRFAEIRDANGRTVGGGGGGGGGGGTPLPATVRFTDLSNGGGPYGYFATRCNNCHRAGNAAGGLDLTNYTQAFNRANAIKSRVNDPTRPMPPNGLLPQYDRDVITKWVDTGALQN